jgi:O-antigen/teichoic acid export membrane protein
MNESTPAVPEAGGAASGKELKFLLRHSSIYGLGNLLSRAVAFLMLPLYTRYLTPTDYGVLELIDVTTGMIAIVIGLGLDAAVSRFYYESPDESDRRAVLSTAYWLAALLALVGLALAATFSAPMARLVLNSASNARLFLVAFTTLVVAMILELDLLYLRLNYKSVLFNVVSILSLVLGVGLNVVFIVVFHWGVFGILMTSLITRLVIAVPLTTWVLSKTGFRFDRGLARQMVRFGAPLIPSTLGTAIVNYSDRYFLKQFATIADAGIWGLANKLGTSIHMLITSPFILTFVPRRFEIAQREDAKETFGRVSEYYFLLITSCGFLVALLADDILHVMTTPPFFRAAAFVPWVVLTMIFYGMRYHFEFGILYAKKTHYYAVINVASAVLHVGLNFFLVRSYGIAGAAGASVVALLVNSIATYVVGQHLYRIPFAIGRKLRVLLIAAALCVLARFVHPPTLLASVGLKTALVAVYLGLLVVTHSILPEDLGRARRLLARLVPRRGA